MLPLPGLVVSPPIDPSPQLVRFATIGRMPIDTLSNQNGLTINSTSFFARRSYVLRGHWLALAPVFAHTRNVIGPSLASYVENTTDLTPLSIRMALELPPATGIGAPNDPPWETPNAGGATYPVQFEGGTRDQIVRPGGLAIGRMIWAKDCGRPSFSGRVWARFLLSSLDANPIVWAGSGRAPQGAYPHNERFAGNGFGTASPARVDEVGVNDTEWLRNVPAYPDIVGFVGIPAPEDAPLVRSYLFDGDSTVAGVGDGDGGAADIGSTDSPDIMPRGWAEKAMLLHPYATGVITAADTSLLYTTWDSRAFTLSPGSPNPRAAVRVELARRFCDAAIAGWGVGDANAIDNGGAVGLTPGPGAYTLAQMKDSYGRYSAAIDPIPLYIATAFTFAGGTTDGWATTSGQYGIDPQVANVRRAQSEAVKQEKAAGLLPVDLAVVQTSGRLRAWLPHMTSDGIHPNTAGANAIAASVSLP